MQKKHFEVETDGFYGAYWKCQRARLDIDQRVRNAVAEWKSAEK